MTSMEAGVASGAEIIEFDLDHRNASPQLVGVMHANGLLVSVWTIEKAKEAVRALRMGVDNVTTQNPALVRLMLPRIRLF